MVDILQLKEGGQPRYLKTHVDAVDGLKDAVVSKVGNETALGTKNFRDGLQVGGVPVEPNAGESIKTSGNSYLQNGQVYLGNKMWIGWATVEIERADGHSWKTGDGVQLGNVSIKNGVKLPYMKNMGSDQDDLICILNYTARPVYTDGGFSDYQITVNPAWGSYREPTVSFVNLPSGGVKKLVVTGVIMYNAPAPKA